MRDATRAAIEACVHQSHAGELHFGEVVARLSAAGVESYRADYRRGETTFYLPTGETLAVPLAGAAAPVAEAFDAEAIRAAIRGAQRGEVRYPEFVARTRAAGCAGYCVWISGRHVAYHGRRGETLVEPFPGSP